MENKNVWNNIDECKSILNRWLQSGDVTAQDAPSRGGGGGG